MMAWAMIGTNQFAKRVFWELKSRKQESDLSKQTYQARTSLNIDVFTLRQQDKAAGRDRRLSSGE